MSVKRCGQLSRTVDAARFARTIGFGALMVAAVVGEFSPVPAGKAALRAAEIDAAWEANVAPNWRQRKGQAKVEAIASHGGSEAGEAAVAKALEWLAEHQFAGSWDFRHGDGPCQNRCDQIGTIPRAKNAATALALLCFFGAGQTPTEGRHHETVARGLEYLLKSGQDRNEGLSYMDGGTMYSHGLSTIALCEAYAMTGDLEVKRTAQRAIDFTVYAQDPVGGGWRYMPRTPGDTSVLGWQMQSLRAARLAGLSVPPETRKNAGRFLSSVGNPQDTEFGYTAQGSGAATSAIGLAARYELGRLPNDESLVRGVSKLTGDDAFKSNNLYMHYHLQELARNVGGERWTAMNSKLRDRLVEMQARQGHATGSFSLGAEPHAVSGGRLYATTFATLILEVYYRYPVEGK